MISIRVDPKAARQPGPRHNPQHLRKKAVRPGRKPRDVISVKP